MDENVIIFILWLPESYGTINRNEMNKMQKNQNDKSILPSYRYGTH